MPGLEWIMELPHYRYGVTLFGLIAVLPALVSGNMLIHEIIRLQTGHEAASWQAVFMNAAVLLLCTGLIAAALWQWL